MVVTSKFEITMGLLVHWSQQQRIESFNGVVKKVSVVTLISWTWLIKPSTWCGRKMLRKPESRRTSNNMHHVHVESTIGYSLKNSSNPSGKLDVLTLFSGIPINRKRGRERKVNAKKSLKRHGKNRGSRWSRSTTRYRCGWYLKTVKGSTREITKVRDIKASKTAWLQEIRSRGVFNMG